MPLTAYQSEVAQLLSVNRTEDSYLAGGAALNLEPQTQRYSNDLDYFHDSVERVATAFENDCKMLEGAGHAVSLEMKQPGYVRALVSKGSVSTKVEWAHDSAWRFLPTVKNPVSGYQLHPIDLAINKVLALAGRDEARDYLDILHIHREILPLGALCWAGAGKDPGFSPRSLLELLRRRGKYQPDEFKRLRLAAPVDLHALKAEWLAALDDAEAFVNGAPPGEAGCLYYSTSGKKFVQPSVATARSNSIVTHYGKPGGVLPRIVE